MANWDTLKAAVAQYIKTNGNEEITGQILQDVLNNIISNIGDGFTYKDYAFPDTVPITTPDGTIFYIAYAKGTYVNFSGIELSGDSMVLLRYNNDTGNWYIDDLGIKTIDNRLFRKSSIIETENKYKLLKAIKNISIYNPVGNYSAFYLQDIYCDAESVGFADLYQIKLFGDGIEVARYSITDVAKDISEYEILELSQINLSGVKCKIEIDWKEIKGLRFDEINTGVDSNTYNINIFNINNNGINVLNESRFKKQSIFRYDSDITSNAQKLFDYAISQCKFYSDGQKYQNIYLQDIYSDVSTNPNLYQIRVFSDGIRIAEYSVTDSEKDITKTERVWLSEYNNSGFYGYIDIDWSLIRGRSATEANTVALSTTFIINNSDIVYNLKNIGHLSIFKNSSSIDTGLKKTLELAILDLMVLGNVELYTQYYLQDIYCNYASNPNLYQIRLYGYNGSSYVRLAQFSETNESKDLTESEVVFLDSYLDSGISAKIEIDWSKIDGLHYNQADTGVTNDTFKIKDSRIIGGVVNEPFETSNGIIGVNVFNFQLNGINAKLHTSSLFGQKGHKDYLMILCHGNGKDYTYNPTSTFVAYLESAGISFACITGQDQVTPDFTTDKLGWGNYSHVNRQIQLYKHLMEKYNGALHEEIIILGDSMGMLAAGQILYKKQIPCLFGICLGGVPDLSYIFNIGTTGGGTDRRPAIRAAYGMAQDGSNDANLEDFIKGYDWFDMGRYDDGVNIYKWGYPNLYMYLGTADITGSIQFGGILKYESIRDSLINAGVLATSLEFPALSHDDDSIFNQILTDNIIEKELGLNG